MITIKDIAKAARVAHTTVSRALNGNPAVNEQTATRIRLLAREMGYVPNVVAQNLKTKSTRAIGMVLTTMTDPFLARVVEGVEQAAVEAGYALFVSTSHDDPKREMGVIRTLRQRRVDAIIIASMWVSNIYGEELKRLRIPAVLINHALEGEHLRYVTVDDVKASRDAVSYLISLGHRRIGYVKSADRPNTYVQNRLTGYQHALQAAGMVFDSRAVISSEGSTDFERGMNSLKFLRSIRATAAFCYNDLTALGLLRACQEKGIRVPQDLSVMGFDDLECAQYVSPTLTTVRQPRAELGVLAMRLATDLVQRRKGVDIESIEVRTELVERESTRKVRG